MTSELVELTRQAARCESPPVTMARSKVTPISPSWLRKV
eukprot:CAMPEP_0119391356 /NCGR_PEP_ID=MMETSP1334-20130426/116781_1 /TAXON_ID=127549 /ORGANISM="Calcidiscus leptoporus, Strain RCC1130" /LENGTH=38 /DNA_ID= /DNA_START= /DNA_END= /DNA_ORIENTATION=